MTDDGPMDPFHGDPTDPAAALDHEEAHAAPLTAAEREDVLADLDDLDVFEQILSSRGLRGIVVDCDDCGEPHYFAWDLMRANLMHLLDLGQTRVHEPAYQPNPADYVSWDYARGFVDGVVASAEA